MTSPEDPKPPTHKGRAAGLEMLGLGLIAIGTMLALAALTGGTARQIAGGMGLPLVFIGILIRRKSRSLLWASSECCPGCGYDLSLSSPKRCPQCGLERSQWPDLERSSSPRRLVTIIAVALGITIAAGLVFALYGHISTVRWPALVLLIVGFATAAFSVFSLPAPKA